jgi:hypothetical protein
VVTRRSGVVLTHAAGTSSRPHGGAIRDRPLSYCHEDEKSKSVWRFTSRNTPTFSFAVNLFFQRRFGSFANPLEMHIFLFRMLHC